MMRVSPRIDAEADVAKDGLLVEGDGDVAELDDGDAFGESVDGTAGFGEGDGCHALSAEDADHQLGDEEVEKDDEDRGDDDGLGGGAADALRAAGGGHAVVAADGGDDEAGEKWLDEAFDDVAVDERHVGGVEEG